MEYTAYQWCAADEIHRRVANSNYINLKRRKLLLIKRSSETVKSDL